MKIKIKSQTPEEIEKNNKLLDDIPFLKKYLEKKLLESLAKADPKFFR